MQFSIAPFPFAPLAIASVFCLCAAQAAHAAPVLNASSTASAGVDVATPSGTGPDASFVNEFAFIDNTQGQGSGYAFAASSGAYAVSSSAAGQATGTASASFFQTFTNTSGVAQFYTLNFFIYGGSISTSVDDPDGLTGAEFLKAGYSASIQFGGNTVFSSSAQLDRDVNGTALSTAGTALNGGTLDGDTYYWDSATYSVALGLVDAGESFDILAEVMDHAEADVGVYNFGGSGYGGYGCGFDEIPSNTSRGAAIEEVCFKGSARAFYGDPIDLGSQTPGPVGQFQITPTQVPEPGSLALVLAALGAGTLATRRRRAEPVAG